MAQRLHQLDALRGIAAFSVLLSHVFLLLPVVWETSTPAGQPWILQLAMFSPLRVFWAGHEAVIFFFFLSGFVLALPFFNNRHAAPYPLYLTKRVLRIYTPYLAAVLSALALRELFFNGPVPSVSAWFNQSWQSPVTPGVVGNHMLMIGSFKNCDFNPVLWSLVHEMRISIFFPLIAWGLIKFEKTFLTLPILFTLTYQLAISLKFRGMLDFEHDYFSTLHYTGFFIIGAFLAKHRKRILESAVGLRRYHKWLLIIAAILAYSNAFWLRQHVISGPEAGWLATLVSKKWCQEWITAAGVAVIIILSLSSVAMSRTLAFKPLEFLGSISYSLYLFHALVLKVLVTVLIGTMPLIAILPIVVLVSLLVATLSWRFIEVPSIDIGRKITNLWRQRSTIASNPLCDEPSRTLTMGSNASRR